MAAKRAVWVIDDDHAIRWVLEKALQQAGIEVKCFDSGEKILKLLDRKQPQVIITDIRMPGPSGLELLESIQAKAGSIPVIIMTAHSDLDSAVASYQGGAFEYLPKPFDVDDAVNLIQRAIDHQKQNKQEVIDHKQYKKDIIGEAPAMQEVFRAIGRLSNSDLNVLINGQSGTGKELVAQALHNHSPRAGEAFIAINIAAIPVELLESELFGHERGAFTGALQQRKGRFEQANGGTLFLDEIGDMPSELQTRLLRVLADGKFYRVGGHVQIETDVRIIAATNQNLEQRVAQGRFREDLFHRLNVIRIHLPTLQQRREDIPTLIDHFLGKSAKELGVDVKKIDNDTLDYLCNLPWPGNVRQLENTCQWLTVMAPGQSIGISDLPPELKTETGSQNKVKNWENELRSRISYLLASGQPDVYKELNEIFERTLIEEALKYTHGRKQDAAKKLGWGRNTLTRKLKELDLQQD